MDITDKQLNPGLAILITRYATPFAVASVTMAVVLSQPRSPYREYSIGLLALSVVFNLGALEWIKARRADASGVIKLRLILNFLVNVGLVYMLGGYFSAIWLLFALTPIATAIYDTKVKTLGVSVLASAALLLIHAARGNTSPLDWGETASRALFIILMSLMINELAHFTKSARP